MSNSNLISFTVVKFHNATEILVNVALRKKKKLELGRVSYLYMKCYKFEKNV